MPNTRHGSFVALTPEWLRGYRADWLRPDLVAGLIAAAVVIPKAMAYATIAGLPVAVGFYTAFLPMAVYALLGQSRALSVSTTTTLAILAAAALGEVASGGAPASLLTASATLTVLVGVILVMASVLRLGFVADFISAPVLVGFKAAIGLVIVVDQLPKLLGVHLDKGPFLRHLLDIVRAIPQASLPTVAVAAAMIAILVAVKRFLPHAPAPLIAVAAGIAATSLLGLEALGVRTVGQVPTGLPSLTVPDLSLVVGLWPAAVGIALMSFTETVAAGRAFIRTGEATPQANRELLATGLGNLGGALLGSMPAGGGTSQTAVNRLAGAQSQLAGLVTAAASLLTMLVLAPFIGRMPEATLAAVVIVYSVGLIEPREFRAILAVRRTEFVWALSALAGVVVLGTLKGIVVAIIVSVVALASQVANPPVHVLGRRPGSNVFRPRSAEHPDDEEFPGLLMLRLEGRLFFMNVERTVDRIRTLVAETSPAVLALDLSAVFDLEYTALKTLTDMEGQLGRQGVELWLVGLNPGVLAMVERSALGATLQPDRMLFDLEHAVARYRSRADA